MRYISDGTWFIAGTEATLIDDYRPQMNGGLFRGLRRCVSPASECCPLGVVYEDEEVCGFDEFTATETDNRFTRKHPHPVIAFRQRPRWRRLFGAWGICRQYRAWDNGRWDSLVLTWRAVVWR